MFPFDSIHCQLVFESYSFNTDEVNLQWHDVPVTMMEKVELPDFDLIGWGTDRQELQYPNGNWQRAIVRDVILFQTFELYISGEIYLCKALWVLSFPKLLSHIYYGN